MHLLNIEKNFSQVYRKSERSNAFESRKASAGFVSTKENRWKFSGCNSVS